MNKAQSVANVGETMIHHFLSPAIILLCVSLGTPSLSAQAPEDQRPPQRGAPTAASFPEALVLPALEGPKPWSDKPVLNDPNRFHIAIMTDHTGGHRPGIWMKAVHRVNLLRPQFVMSIGDLIEGNTEDRNQIEAEWKEFLGFIEQMEMKFFFVAGNHDLSNPVMHEIWRKHFGPEWYSFDYQAVHFVCLCSEDPVTKISDQQLAWVERDLANHRDARWTLLFFHKPLWVTAEEEMAAGRPDPTNWKKVEALLGRRPHTVFAGHVHHYTQYDRNGMKYYHLATTGGSSQLRGVPYGEFDHVTWLTMEKDGPHVTHLLLEGMLPPDEVTEQSISRFRDFLAVTQIEIAPILLDDERGFSEGRIDMRLTNGFTSKVEITGRIEGLPLRGLSVDPAELTLTAAPSETTELAVRIRFRERVPFQHLAETFFTAKIKTIGEEKPLTASRTVPVVIDQKYPCALNTRRGAIDGKLNEWPRFELSTGSKPVLIGKSEQWQGVGDASLFFSVAHDGEHLYFAAQIIDDRVFPEDAVEIRLDARPMNVRQSDKRLRQGTYLFHISAPIQERKAVLEVNGAKSRDKYRMAALPSRAGYDVELAIPIELLTKEQGEHWQNFQLTALVVDADEMQEGPCRVVWRGTTEVDRRNSNFGHFVRSR